MDLIINSGLGLTSKVIGPLSGFEFITFDSCTSTHFQFVFYIFCIIWNKSNLLKYLVIQLIWYANPDIQQLVFYQTQSFPFLYDCKQFKSPPLCSLNCRVRKKPICYTEPASLQVRNIPLFSHLGLAMLTRG